MKKVFGCLLVVCGLLSCKNEPAAPAKIVHLDSAVSTRIAPLVTVANDTLIRMLFKVADTGTIASARGIMNGEGSVICEVTIQKADSLHATVTPEEASGNVRFVQIILPDGKADGPFSRELRYATPQTGTYQLRISENQMAGDKWKGNFKVKVWVK